MANSAIQAARALTLATVLSVSARDARAASSPMPPVAVPNSGGSCTFRTTEISAATSFDQSTSTSFVKLGQAGSISFAQNQTGCVAGTFFANAGNESEGDHVLLQVLLDGTTCAPLTRGYIFANEGSDVSSHSVAFFCGARVARGRHTVQVQFASGFGGNATFFQRTLSVAHE